ncbi:MAG TPA: type I-D CRISPR-associated protein Cas5/Csc1 [Candidatus Limnocylindrales bacterium]|nr:type I-D CRISPR-associated protein Cas5/Csc1 [Candidatus Limnocylindrales bacterium]
MRILECELEFHDFVYFATREVGRLYETEALIHNYALCYALGLVVSPYFVRQQIPQYREDLSDLNQRGIYVTPAVSIRHSFSLHTWKYAINWYHVDMEKLKRDLWGKNVPGFGRAKELAPESLFRFFIFDQTDRYKPPPWIRLGKWLAKAHLDWHECRIKSERSGSYVATHPLNPLDVLPMSRLRLCDYINMPPISLINNAHLEGNYLIVEGPGGSFCFPAGMQFNFTGDRQS